MALISKDDFAKWIIDLAIDNNYHRAYNPNVSKDVYCADIHLIRAARDYALQHGTLARGMHHDVHVVYGQYFRDWADMDIHRNLQFDLQRNILGYGPYTDEISAWAERPLTSNHWDHRTPPLGFCDITLGDLFKPLLE